MCRQSTPLLDYKGARLLWGCAIAPRESLMLLLRTRRFYAQLDWMMCVDACLRQLFSESQGFILTYVMMSVASLGRSKDHTESRVSEILWWVHGSDFNVVVLWNETKPGQCYRLNDFRNGLNWRHGVQRELKRVVTPILIHFIAFRCWRIQILQLK